MIRVIRANFGKPKESIKGYFHLILKIFIQLSTDSKNTKVLVNSERVKNLKLLLTGEVGLYSSWQGWGYIQAGVLLFQKCFLIGVVLVFEWSEVLLKSGVTFKRIRYMECISCYSDQA